MATTLANMMTRVLDANGDAVPGAKLYVYQAGTTTPTSFYTDSAVTVPAANPLIADAGGLLVPLWAKDGTYKLVFTDSAGAALYTLDNFSISASGGGSTSVSMPVVAKTANYTVAATDRNVVFVCDASLAVGQNIVITADSATLTNGFPFTVVNIGAAGTVTVVGVSSQLINQSASFTLSAQNQAATFDSSGAAGWVISSSTSGAFINAVTFYAGATMNGKLQLNAAVAYKEQTVTWVSSPATTTIDPAAGPDMVLTLSGAAMIMGALASQSSNVGVKGQLRILQDATGGRTITWDSTFVMSDGSAPSIDAVANAETVFNYWIKAGSGSASVILTRRTGYLMQQRTAQPTTSGTSIDFSNIPAWAKKITISLNAISTSGSSVVQVQLGTSGGIVSTGYAGDASFVGASSNVLSSTAGILTSPTGGAAGSRTGVITLVNISGNVWVAGGSGADFGLSFGWMTGSVVTLSGALTTVRLTTANGTDTFDVGSIGLLIEG